MRKYLFHLKGKVSQCLSLNILLCGICGVGRLEEDLTAEGGGGRRVLWGVARETVLLISGTNMAREVFKGEAS